MHVFSRGVFPLLLLVACSGNADEPYKAQPAWSGAKPSLPTPPPIASTPIKTGDSFTVGGASHHLRSLVHEKEVTAAPITIAGYIVETNYAKAPDCAVHPSGKGDPPSCTDIPIPSFWIADIKGDTKGPKIQVIGWARNFAMVYDAMKAYGAVKDTPSERELVRDNQLNVVVPFPLPSVGAKVKVTGKYGVSGRLTGDMVANPMFGVLTFQKLETVETAPDRAVFAKKI
jgi:hypothetical protein